MIKYIKNFFFLMLVVLLLSGNSFAASLFTAAINGNWSNSGNWTTAKPECWGINNNQCGKRDKYLLAIYGRDGYDTGMGVLTIFAFSPWCLCRISKKMVSRIR